MRCRLCHTTYYGQIVQWEDVFVLGVVELDFGPQLEGDVFVSFVSKSNRYAIQNSHVPYPSSIIMRHQLQIPYRQTRTTTRTLNKPSKRNTQTQTIRIQPRTTLPIGKAINDKVPVFIAARETGLACPTPVAKPEFDSTAGGLPVAL